MASRVRDRAEDPHEIVKEWMHNATIQESKIDNTLSFISFSGSKYASLGPVILLTRTLLPGLNLGSKAEKIWQVRGVACQQDRENFPKTTELIPVLKELVEECSSLYAKSKDDFDMTADPKRAATSEVLQDEAIGLCFLRLERSDCVDTDPFIMYQDKVYENAKAKQQMQRDSFIIALKMVPTKVYCRNSMMDIVFKCERCKLCIKPRDDTVSETRLEAGINDF